MPTENRSSNTEMVSVPRHPTEEMLVAGQEAWATRPRGALEDCEEAGHIWAAMVDSAPAPQPHPDPIAWMVGTAIWWTKEEAERDAGATGLPIVGLGPMSGIAAAQQHQGEPISLPARKVHKKGNSPMQNAKNSAWNACLDEIAKLGPLCAHADPGEVKRLIAQCVEKDALIAEMDRIGSAKLAERDALLADIAKRHWSGVDFDLPADLVARIKALPANAEPIAKIPHSCGLDSQSKCGACARPGASS